MIERQEVEALLAACEPGSDAFVPAMDQMTRRKMRALCRAWLALEDAPVRNVVGQQWDDVFAREGNVVWCSDLHPGQRVRIVPVEEVGVSVDLETGASRAWYMGPDGVKRWADTGEPVGPDVDDEEARVSKTRHP